MIKYPLYIEIGKRHLFRRYWILDLLIDMKSILHVEEILISF